MRDDGPRLAKLTRPRSGSAIPRRRLFSKLDRTLAEHAAACVVGPPGAGKTTLVTTWVEASKRDCLWLQIDPDDADPATFFHYLHLAAERFDGAAPLPVLRPEYAASLESFARRFFRALFQRLPTEMPLVLDNYQEAPASSPLHALLAIAIEEAPHGSNVIMISRRDPPDSYARLLANRNIGVVAWSDLRLTLDECEEIARVRCGLWPEHVHQLHQQCDGWAAGFTLLLERVQRDATTIEPNDADSLRTVFHYFATQLYERDSPLRQRILLELSFLPCIPESAARRLTGQSGVALLEEMHERHLFTERRKAREPIYQFHGLLGAFLRDTAQRRLAPGHQAAARRRAARALEATGHAWDTWPMYLAAGAAEEALRIILAEAPGLVAQGRWRSVIDAIESLPPGMATTDPLLGLWLGYAKMALDPVQARSVLEACHALALSRGDPLCQVQAASGVIQTYILQYTQFKPLDAWIKVLSEALRSGVSFPSLEAELRVQSALLIALAYRDPSHPILPDCVERVLNLVQENLDINLRTIGAAYAFGYGATTGPTALSRRALPVLQHLLEHPNVTPLNRAWSHFLIAWFHCVSGDFEQSERAAEEIDRLQRDEGLPLIRKFHLIISGWREMFRGSPDTAWTWIQQLPAIQHPGRPYDTATYHVTTAWHHVISGRPDAALEHYAKGLALFDEVGSIMHQVIYRFYAAFAFCACGQVADAYRVLAEARTAAGRGLTTWQACALLSAEAYAALSEGDRARASRAVSERFRLGRLEGEEHGVVRVLGKFMPRLCALALEHGIEVDHVRQLIRVHEWESPDPADPNWPTWIRVQTLGQFSVAVRGKPLSFSRKVPRKPLAVLKMLIAMGGAEVPEQRLIDNLWPDEDGDAAYSAYKVALHRLRTLLGEGCVVTEGGTLSLNPERCWVDLWELDGLLSTARMRLSAESGDEFLDGGDGARMAARIEALYAGPFLAAEADASWVMPQRAKLQRRYVEFVEVVGGRLERGGRWNEAADWYSRAIQVDGLAESLHRGLIRCYQRTGRRSEALSAYQRMQRALVTGLGIPPSAESERLYRTLIALEAGSER